MRHIMKKSGGLELSHIDIDAAAANEGNNISVKEASVGGAPAGNITHHYSSKLSLEEDDLYERRK